MIIQSENVTCSKCGGATLTPSALIAIGSYGSKYNTEKMTIRLCSSCFDSIADSIREQISFEAMDVDFQL